MKKSKTNEHTKTKQLLAPSQKPTEAVGKDKPFVRLARKNVLELRITSFDEDGYGTARSEEGMTLKVAGGVPGDTLLAGVDHVTGGTAFCHVKKLLQPSPLRSVSPPCRESSNCLGCSLIAIKYTEQKNWKRGMILAEMAKYSCLSAVVLHPLLSPDNLIHYRTTAKLTVAGKFSEPYIGIYRRASHDIYDLEECPIHHPLIDKVVAAVRRGIKKGRVHIYNPQSRMGLLRYLVVRVSTFEKKAMVVFVTSQRSFNEIHHLGRFIQEVVPEVEVVVQNVNATEGNVIMGQKDYFLTKKQYLTERIGDVSFRISPRSFFQVNNSGAYLIYNKVREWAGLTGQEAVLDLYCGIGGISLFLADRAKTVVGVEVIEEAVADATMNARINGIKNCLFKAGDVADLLDGMTEEKQPVDVAVLNPPRKGCDLKVLERLAVLEPKSIIYVSCSPQSLTRDMDILNKLGYFCPEIQPVDMFPQTVHIENVARFEKVGNRQVS